MESEGFFRILERNDSDISVLTGQVPDHRNPRKEEIYLLTLQNSKWRHLCVVADTINAAASVIKRDEAEPRDDVDFVSV